MNNLKDLKNQYEAIIASEKFKKETEKLIARKGMYAMLKKTLYFAASLAAAFVITVNCAPKLASAAEGIPILGPVVRVVTFGRFEFKDKGFEATVVTPKIEGLLDKELEDRLNAEFKENADTVIKAFEKDVREIKEEFGSDDVHFGVDANYTVKTDNENILAIDTYILNTAGSSSTKHSYYTIDKKSGQLLTLKQLFNDNADYITPISEYIKSEMERINREEDGMFWIGKQPEGFDGFEKIKADQNFYINDSGNPVICFDKYEVAAGAQGCPEFEIPAEITKDIS